jgi:maltose alpha-D-glucosyltransferase/alpha-amylase
VDRAAAVEKFEFGAMREWSTETGSWLLATIAVSLFDGSVHRFAIPLSLAWEDEAEGGAGAPLHATLAKVRRHARVGVLFDAFWDDRFCCAVVSAMERGETLSFGEGTLEFRVTGAYPGYACNPAPAGIRRAVSEHGRLRVNLDDRLVLKGYRWLLAGTHPELEMSRFLTETAKFPHVPQLAGTVEFVNAQGPRSTLAIMECYAANQGDAWTYTLDYLERFLDTCRASPEQAQDARHSAYMELMKVFGQRTAEFHRALALPDDAGDFGSEPVGAQDILDWIHKDRHEMERMFESLEQALPQLPETALPVARSLLAARPKLYRRIMRASGVRLDAMKTRCHGNYHLGQVWLVKNDCLIANYGGEPGRSWAERRCKHVPLRDVAGMLLSLGAAGAAALDRVAGDSAEAAAALQRQVDEWEALARRTFFRSYRRAMSGHPAYPADAGAAEALLTLFLAEKAISDASEALARHAPGTRAALRRLLQVTQR